MVINCSFYGCSCGCTPQDDPSFEGEEPDIYAVIAEWAMNYTVHGSDPFRKLSIPQQTKDLLLKVYDFSDKIEDLTSKKETLVSKNESYENAAKTLGVEIPKEKQDEIAINVSYITSLGQQINELTAQKNSVLLRDYSKAHKIEVETE
jgi:hypothetical protein